MAFKLTIKQVESLLPSPVRMEVPDAAAPGLHLVVQPSGIKSWAFRYRRRPDLKPRKFTIGRFPDYSLAEAREEAMELARSVRRGTDPAEERKQAKARALDKGDTVSAQLDEFLKNYVRKNGKPNTIAQYEQVIEAEIRPAWGDRKIGSITRRDVIDLLDALVDRGVTTHANRVFSSTRKFFNWLVEKDRLPASPCAGVKAPVKEKGRERILSGDEIRWLWLATNEGDLFDYCVRILLLSAQRRMEIGGLLEPEIHGDDEAPHILLPPERTKNGLEHMVPLTRTIAFELKDARDWAAENPLDKSSPDRDLIFRLKPTSGWTKLKARLDARMLYYAKLEAERDGRNPEAVTIPNWTIHDLRRTAASRMAKLKVEPHIIEALLNHITGKVSGVARVYNRYEYFDEKRDALERWERFVVHHCEGPVFDVEEKDGGADDRAA